MRILYTIFLLILFPVAAAAQFYVTGDDPGKLKWNFIDTESFRIIYPQKADSLARIYGYKLEKYKIPVSRTTGFMAGDGDGRIMPVVLHTFNGSNGSVAWAPKRMDLFTIPTAYDPTPMPWSTMLTVHEGRHVTQMQFGMTKAHKPFSIAFGQMWNILVSLVYPGMYFLEGDAVVAETALTTSGRGRTADFLNYYRVAFDNGDYRNWERWSYGSQKYYAPNHYALGYMRLAGARYIYDYPEVMKDGYDMARRKIFNFSPFFTLIRKKSGKNNDESFKEICDTMQGIWSRDVRERAPFIQMEQVSGNNRHYTDYNNNLFIGGNLYSLKSGFADTPTLVRIDSHGDEVFIARFARNISNFRSDGEYLYWSEDTPDYRWSMKSDSRIRRLKINGKKENVTGRDASLFNPSFCSDTLVTTEYYPEGGSAVHIGEKTYHAPDSLQIVETVCIGNNVYASAISDNGFGIYSLNGSPRIWDVVLSPQPVKIKDLSKYNDDIIFTSDRTGVNELYHLNPVTGELRQKTVTKYGAEDFCYGNGYLYFSSQTLDGKKIFRTHIDSLIDRKVDFAQRYKYILAENLTKQERRIAEDSGDSQVEDTNSTITFSEPERYRKSTHIFNIHSWAPVYVSVDNIMNMSFDHIYQAASLGAVGIMQNSLATCVGEIGYSAHKDPYDKSKWRHSGHFKFTYSGLYPVIEASVDFNDRSSIQYNIIETVKNDGNSIGLYPSLQSNPYIEGKLSTYIPFNLSSGGWNSGVIPKLSYRISNDRINTTIVRLDGTDNGLGMFSKGPGFYDSIKGKTTFRHSLTGSLRGYYTMSIPNSAVYPRFGIGAEMGAMGDLSNSHILSPMGYAYVYGYLPGITRTQGIKLTAMHQMMLSDKAIFGQSMTNILPRGLSNNSSLLQRISIQFPHITKLSADYAIPVYIGDISIGKGFIYIKRLTVTPHADYTRFGDYNLLSVGSSLTFDLNGVIWIGWPVSIGASYSYNNLCDFSKIQNATGIEMNKNHVGFVFNVSF